MIDYILDTPLVFYALRSRPKELLERFREHDGRMGLSAVTHAELIYQARSSSAPIHNLGVIDSFVARLEIIPFNLEAANQLGQLRLEVRNLGITEVPSLGDLMVIAQARAGGLILASHGTNLEGKIPGVRVSVW